MFRLGKKKIEKPVVSTEEKKTEFDFDVGRVYVRFHFEFLL